MIAKGLLEVITTLQNTSSLKWYQMDEKVLTNEIDTRISIITKLKQSYQTKNLESQQIIQSLNVRNSKTTCVEYQITCTQRNVGRMLLGYQLCLDTSH